MLRILFLRRLKLKLAIAAIAFLPLWLCSSQFDEYLLKAVYLEKFTRFIEWSPDCETDNLSKPFIICVLGENPFGDILDSVYSKQKIKNLNVRIRYALKIEQIPTRCHILFISKSMDYDLKSVLTFTKNKSILTIGDTKGFAEQGVMINFVEAESNIRFQINAQEVKESGLKMSYLLQNLAEIVYPKKD